MTLAELRERAERVAALERWLKSGGTPPETTAHPIPIGDAHALIAALCRVVEAHRAYYYSGPMSEEDAEDWDNAIHEEQANLDALLREVDGG